MEHQIDLTAQHRPEVLERILRVIRHRGFTVTQMDMQLIDDKVRLKFTVKSDRTLDLLVSQLEKLPDVLEINSEQGK
jgi:acetolactate synthase isozyme II small subunit